MIDYEKYAEFRDSKGLKDSDVAKRAGIYQSVFSDWKKKKSAPKLDKMQKIAEALEMDYRDFVGPVGKYSSLNPDIPHTNITIEVGKANDKYADRMREYVQRIAKLSENGQKELFN